MSVDRDYLSSSTDGRAIKVAATGSPGTAIHTSTGMEAVYLWAGNIDAVQHQLTLEWPGGEVLQFVLEPLEFLLLIPGLTIASAQALAAYADTANVINVLGHVNRIT